MTQDELDRILASEEPLEPTSGFVKNVMNAVQTEAPAPRRQRFPWLGFAGGVAGSGAVAIASSAAIARGYAPELAYATATLLITLALASLPTVLDR